MNPDLSFPTENAKCGICGSVLLKPLFRATDKNFNTTSELFLIAKCSGCHIVQTHPRPGIAEISRFYPPAYYPTQGLEGDEYDRQIGRFQTEKLNHLKGHFKSGRLLDVGCGVGYFLKAAASSGFEAKGIEFSDKAAEIGRSRFGLTITTGDLLNLDLADASFDAITFWHALEHLHDPKAAIQKSQRLLDKGGVLVIAVPNFASIQAKVFRSEWYHLEIPRHLFHFTPASLSQLVKQSGFRVVNTVFHSREHNWAGILGSVMHLAPKQESLFHKVLRKTVGLYASRALAAVEATLGYGGTFELHAIKQ